MEKENSDLRESLEFTHKSMATLTERADTQQKTLSKFTEDVNKLTQHTCIRGVLLLFVSGVFLTLPGLCATYHQLSHMLGRLTISGTWARRGERDPADKKQQTPPYICV